MLLSALYVRHRDLDEVWQWSFGSCCSTDRRSCTWPTMLPDSVERVMMINPLAAIFTEMRHALIDPDAPTSGRRDRRRRVAPDPARRSCSRCSPSAVGLQAREPDGSRRTADFSTMTIVEGTAPAARATAGAGPGRHSS